MGQLEDRAVVRGASSIRCAVQVAAAVHDQAGIRVLAVLAVEGSQRGDRAAAMGQLEDRAVVRGASPIRGAVQVAAAVHDQCSSGLVTVGAVEGSQRGDRAAAMGQLEDRAVVRGASPIGGAVQIAAAVHDQCSFGLVTVGTVERSQRGDRAAAMGQLEDRAVVRGAPKGRCAVQVAAAVHDQAGGALTVGVERSQRGNYAAAAGQLEDRAVVRGAPKERCAVQVAAAVHDQARAGPHRRCR